MTFFRHRLMFYSFNWCSVLRQNFKCLHWWCMPVMRRRFECYLQPKSLWELPYLACSSAESSWVVVRSSHRNRFPFVALVNFLYFKSIKSKYLFIISKITVFICFKSTKQLINHWGMQWGICRLLRLAQSFFRIRIITQLNEMKINLVRSSKRWP